MQTRRDSIGTSDPHREARILPNLPSPKARRPPSQGFLVILALCGMAGSFVLTPRERIETRTLSTLFALRAGVMKDAPVAERPVVDSAAVEHDMVSRYEYRPLASFLGRRTKNAEMANRIARAIVKESGRLEVAPSLLMGVLLTENPRLETGTVSSQGAIGLMQVMHFHAGEFDCESDDLMQVEANICHGANVFRSYLTSTGDVQRALLRYNGCVASTNTPNCHRYPGKVMKAAHQVRRQLLLYQASHTDPAD
ncbi:MAG: transglycosylase SLT domain-containing protein [Gemmatimonadales bacterium]